MSEGILHKMMIGRFWKNWEMRMSQNNNLYVDPDNPTVKEYAEQFKPVEGKSNVEVAKMLWRHINNNYGYKLTKTWQRPANLINSGVGDCEDYVFLISSLLPHLGVNNFTIIAGEADVNNASELHVWMKVGGEIIDPTAKIGQNKSVTYKPELEFDVALE